MYYVNDHKADFLPEFLQVWSGSPTSSIFFEKSQPYSD